MEADDFEDDEEEEGFDETITADQTDETGETSSAAPESPVESPSDGDSAAPPQ
jgi:hypothetical protein